ncbi:MAG: DEAD/DEAH box helicase family protein [Dorea sp.]|nr:DEAD/DEAH box helicase family protein [Dorea sp.]
MKEWRTQFHKNILAQGKDYYERGRVSFLQEKEGVYTATVIERKNYAVRIIARNQSSYKMSCKCPLAKGGGNCRHMAAVLYAIEALNEENHSMERKKNNHEASLPATELKQNQAKEMEDPAEKPKDGKENQKRLRAEEGHKKPMENPENPEKGWDAPDETDGGEYFILSDSGLQKEPFREPEDEAEPERQENYSYFNFDEIWKSVKFSKKALEKGKALLKHNSIELGGVSPGYLSDEEEQVAIAEGTGAENKWKFPVEIIFSRTEVLHVVCHCRECQSNYWRYMDRNYCAYAYALMSLAEEKVKEREIGSATDKQGERLLRAFRQNQANQVISGVIGRNEGLTLVPRLIEKDGQLKLSFKVGTGKLYVIKDLPEFYQSVKDSSTNIYGTNTKINHAIDNFTETGKQWITFIGNVVQEEVNFEERLIEARTYSKKGLVNKNALDLFGWRLDRFYEIAASGTIAYEKRDEKIKADLKFTEGNPKITMTIRKNTLGETGKFHGITAECDLPLIFYGTKTAYFIKDNAFCKLTEDFAERIRLLAGYSDGSRLVFQIGRNELADFYYVVLDRLEDVIDIVQEDVEVIERYLPAEAEFVFYLDSDHNSILCRPMVRYGGKEIMMLEKQSDKSVSRMMAKEVEVLYLLRQWFPYEDEEQNELHCGGDEELVYRFLSEGVGALMELGEIRCTRRFSNLNVARRMKISAGVSVSSGLLNLDISAENISQEELLDILKSYRGRKKYYRLKNGDFMGLEDESLKMLDEMISVMHLTPKELAKGNIQLPLYRTLYLDKMLQENENVYSERDEHFRNLVREYKTVNDSDFVIPESLKSVMRNYQKKGYRWLRTLENCGFGGILADDMGLGKTLQAIAVLLAARMEGKEGTSLVVAPASLVFNWGEELGRFAPELEVCLLTGTKEDRKQKLLQYREFDVLVTSYDLLKRDVHLYEDKEFLYQIIDEAQYIKNHTTSAAKAVKIIQSRTKYALTGTPIENRLSELWSIFDYLMPGFLYGYDTFKKEFEVPVVKNADAEAMGRLQKMTAPFILRRLKESVLRDLPDKLEKTQYVRFQNEQQNLYDAQVVHMRQTLAGQDEESFQKTRIKVLAELTRLRQICCDPQLCFENYRGESSKLQACMDLLKSAMEGGHKILLFSQFTSMLEIIRGKCAQEGIAFYTITGETPKETRMKLVKRFNGDDTPVFLISLKAGGVGLNLTGADVVIHYDPWWNFAVQNQATDRAHRIGQTKKVTVYRLIAKGSIEEKIIKLQDTKRDLSDQIIQGDGSSLSGMSREDFLELLG